MKTVPLADVLWTAANEKLSTDCRDDLAAEEFSCHAVMAANFGWRWRRRRTADSAAIHFMESLGCRRGAAAHWARDDDSQWTQGVRYMWLLLAMHVAEDENLMVEIAQ